MVLAGTKILVVDDEPLIGLDLQVTLTEAGAHVAVCTDASAALAVVDQGEISAAILDQGMDLEDASALRARLVERGVPILVYSGYRKSTGAPDRHMSKPAAPGAIVDAIAALIKQSPAPPAR